MSQKLSRRKNSHKKKSYSKKTRINRKKTHVKKSRSRFNGLFGPKTEKEKCIERSKKEDKEANYHGKRDYGYICRNEDEDD